MGGAVKKVKKIFSAPSPAPPPPPPPAPTPSTVASTGKSIKSASAKSYLGGARGTSGRKSTMITGGAGVEDEAEILRKTLLGA
tara:strand:+ start:19365 stop:19613 length:249 start_codon:yes stop_codon:yes gene_type:complete